MNTMKRQKDMTLEDEPLRLVSVGETAPERMKRLGKAEIVGVLWVCLVVKVKSDAVKNNSA